MSIYFTYASKESYERYATLNYFPTFNPSQSRNFKSYATTNSYDEGVEFSLEPTEPNYYQTNYPTIMIEPSPYTCICKTESNKYENKIIILIVATSITSFMCVLLVLFIIWYRFFYKRKLMNNSQNNRLFLEKFGVDLTDVNDI
jgi:hypothetical protein